MAAEIVPFVTVEDGRYRVHEETAAWLAERRAPFAVVAFAGLFRTGKSFLCNRLLERPPGRGFGVGETVQACTRGIWLCKEWLAGDNGGPDVLVLDSEGIGALDASDDHDVRVFALAVLLCSAFAYNGSSHIDEGAVQTLSLMTRVAESVGGDAHAPTLYWILRDFALQLADADGKPLTHAAYLEQALDPAGAPAGKCATREAIRAVFPARHLVTLPRPHKGDTAQRLDHKAASALSPRFEKALEVFRAHLREHAKPMAAAGAPMSGAVYAAYATDLAAKVNETGALPKIEDSWTLLARVQHADAEAEARRALLARAEAECPTAPEGRVAAWAAAACEAHVAALRLMPPAPDVAALAARLGEDVLAHCRALGRVRDGAALAREAAAHACDAVAAAGYADPSPLLPTRLDDAEARAAFSEAALARVCTDLWPKALTEARDAAAAEARAALTERDGALEAARAELAEARDAEWGLRAELERATRDDSPAAARPGEDAVGEAHAAAAEAEARADAAAARADHAEATLGSVAARQAELQAAFERGVEELRADAAAQAEACAAAKAAARTAEDQRRAVEAECDKLRGLARDAQERTVEVHRGVLEELRRRDEAAREAADAHRRDAARAEAASLEVRGLKRRVDELLEVAEEAKRLRTSVRTADAGKARAEAEREALRAQLAAQRDEAAAVRRANVDLEGRVAVLQAGARVDAARRGIGGAM